jgi:hypothetical protein
MENKKEDKIYQIKNLSEKQMKVMKDALEMYTRLGLLQFDKVIDHLFSWGKNKNFSDAFVENRDEIARHCYAIKDLLVSKDDELNKYPKNSHWSLGIGGEKTSIDSQIAYEIEKEIENVISTRKRGGLDLSDETTVIVKEENLREEKLKQIVKKLNNKK